MRFVGMVLLPFVYFFLVSMLRKGQRERDWIYFAIGILPFTLNAWNMDVSLVNWAAWPGYAKGLVVTVLDLIALAIIVTHPRPKGMPPLGWFLVTYMLAALLSVGVSGVPMGSFFYAFQLMRIILLVVAVAKIAPNPRSLQWLCMGLAAGIAFQAYYTIWQRTHGAFQASGTMGHQNLLGLMTHFVALPCLAMLLGGVRNRVLMLGVVASLIVLALGASRGSIGFAVMGIVSLCLLSVIRRSTAQKWKIIGMGALALAVIAPFMVESLQHRYETMALPKGGLDERVAFEHAAKMMFHDHPMGVGANQYVIVANTQGYSTKAGVIWNWASRSANVHNTYLLVCAETGWPGIVTFLAMMGAIVLSGFIFAFQNTRDPRGDVVLGCTVAVLAMCAQSFYEWVFVTYQAQYVFGISVGIIAGMIRARKLEKTAKRRPPPPKEEEPVEAVREPEAEEEEEALEPVPAWMDRRTAST